MKTGSLDKIQKTDNFFSFTKLQKDNSNKTDENPCLITTKYKSYGGDDNNEFQPVKPDGYLFKNFDR